MLGKLKYKLGLNFKSKNLQNMFKSISLVLLLTCLMTTSIFAQMSIPFKMEKVHITQFDAPFSTLQIDMTNSELALDKIEITEDTKFINKKKKSVDRDKLFPGVMINIEGSIKTVSYTHLTLPTKA